MADQFRKHEDLALRDYLKRREQAILEFVQEVAEKNSIEQA